MSNKHRNWSSEKVIRNLSKNHLDRFLFLLYYEDFRGITGGNDNVAKVLLNIATELEDQMYVLDKDTISYEVLKRYFRWLNGRFTLTEHRLFSFFRRFDMTIDLRRKVRKYRLMVLRELQQYEESRLSQTAAMLNLYAFPSLSRHGIRNII